MTALVLTPPETDDLPIVEAIELEQGKRFLTSKNELPQGRRADRNLARRPDWSDKNDAAPDFNGWRIFGKVTTVGVHAPNPLPRLPEQLESEAALTANCNPKAINPVCFLPTDNSRLTTPRICQVPDFANDNEPLREVEAA